MTRKLRSILFSLLIMGWLFIVSPYGFADEDMSQNSSQVSPQTPEQIIAAASNAITNANTSLESISGATQYLSDQSTVLPAIETATASIQNAQIAIIVYETATANQAIAQQIVDSATVDLSLKNTIYDSATTALNLATTLVDSQTAVVNTSQTLKNTADNAVSQALSSIQGTTTETFNGNHLNTDINITVNNNTVSTVNQNGVYLSTSYSGSYGMQGSNMAMQSPSSSVVIDFPSDKTITEVGFTSGAKNGNSTGTTNFTDNTTATFVIIDNVSSQYPGYTNKVVVTAPAGKSIDKIILPADWDYYLIDNVYYIYSNGTVSQNLLDAQSQASSQLDQETNLLNVYVSNKQTATSDFNTAKSNLDTATATLRLANIALSDAETSTATAATNLQVAVYDMQNSIISAQEAYDIQKRNEDAIKQALIAANVVHIPHIETTPPQDNTPDTTPPADSTDQTNSDTTNADSSNQDNSSSDNTDTAPQPEVPVDNPSDNTSSQPDVTPVPDPQPSSQDNSTPEVLPGLVENNADSLPETDPKLPEQDKLVAHIQEDKAGVENGGIEFFGTKSQPQVIGEDGKLTPPPPPPGSGLPIPPDAITVAATFIGQPGGTTFNAPDVAVPVIIKPVCVTIKNSDGKEIHVDTNGDEHPIEECTFLPAALESIPGAAQAIEAFNAVYGAMANIGNDMSPITRKKAKKVLVATIVGGQIVALRRRL